MCFVLCFLHQVFSPCGRKQTHISYLYSRQNGLSEDTIAQEVKMSPDTAVAAVSLLTSGLKSSQPPPGDTTVPAATVKRETENSPTDSLGKLKPKSFFSENIFI